MKNKNIDVLIYEIMSIQMNYIIGFLQPTIQPLLLVAEKESCWQTAV